MRYGSAPAEAALSRAWLSGRSTRTSSQRSGTSAFRSPRTTGLACRTAPPARTAIPGACRSGGYSRGGSDTGAATADALLAPSLARRSTTEAARSLAPVPLVYRWSTHGSQLGRGPGRPQGHGAPLAPPPAGAVAGGAEAPSEGPRQDRRLLHAALRQGRALPPARTRASIARRALDVSQLPDRAGDGTGGAGPESGHDTPQCRGAEAAARRLRRAHRPPSRRGHGNRGRPRAPLPPLPLCLPRGGRLQRGAEAALPSRARPATARAADLAAAVPGRGHTTAG